MRLPFKHFILINNPFKIYLLKINISKITLQEQNCKIHTYFNLITACLLDKSIHFLNLFKISQEVRIICNHQELHVYLTGYLAAKVGSGQEVYIESETKSTAELF